MGKWPRMDRELLSALPRRPHRVQRLRVGRDPDPAAAGPVGRGGARRRRAAGHLRQGELLRRADGPRHRDRASCAAGPDPARQAHRRPAGGEQRLALHAQGGRARARGAARRAVRLDAARAHLRPGRHPVRVLDRQVLPVDRPGDARPVARVPRGVRQHAAHRRALRGRRSTPRRTTCRSSRCRTGEDEQSWFVKEIETGLRRRYPSGVPDDVRKQADLRDRRDHPARLRRVLPGGRGLHQLGQGAGHPGRPGPRLGGRLDGRLRDGHHRARPARARPDLRAVPQPRAGVLAGRRRRLRRAPARRGHQVRHRQVRRGPRRPDRHLRHDQGQAGAQGLLARARLPVRDGGEAHQGDAAAGDGQGHPAVRHVRLLARALRRGRGVPAGRRGGPGRPEGARDRARPGGAQAAVGRARRRRDHVERAAASTSSRS